MIFITNLMIMTHDDHCNHNDFSDVPWADDHDTTRDLNMYLGHMIIESERAFSPKSIKTLAQTLIRSTPIRSKKNQN